MKRQTLFAMFAILLMYGSSFAQTRRLMSGAGGQDEASYFFYETFVEPSEPAVEKIGGGIMVGKQIHRVMLDADNRVYFGYDVAIERLPGTNGYRVSFSPLNMAPDELRVFGEDTVTFRALGVPDWGGAAVRDIHPGDVLALTLMNNPKTGQKIVDYVTVTRQSEPPKELGPLPRNFIDEQGTPRDFRSADALLSINPESATLDGASIRIAGGVTAPLPYFPVPQHGRLIISLAPQPDLGFRKAGEIRGSKLTVTFEGHTLNLISNGRIAPGAGPFNVYVLHQPEFTERSWGGTSLEQLRRGAVR